MTDDVGVPLAIWNRFITHDFAIEVDLVGASHAFEYEGCQVKVELPPPEKIPTEPLGEGRLVFSSYRETDRTKTPSYFAVSDVDVVVQTSENLMVPAEILKVRLNAYDLVSDAKQRAFDALAIKYHSIAEKSFLHWIRVLRWKSNNGSIGRPALEGHHSGWSTYLVDQSTGRHFWAQNDPIHVKGFKRLTKSMWSAAEDSLRAGNDSPVSVDMMFDGAEHLKSGDLKRATIDLAVSCETFLRTLVADHLPQQLSSSVRELVDDANIRPVMVKLAPEVLDEHDRKVFKGLESVLHQLFDRRNKVVHKGQWSELNTQECRKYLDATRRLLSLRYPELGE